MDDEAPTKVALERAWTIYLAVHQDGIDPADARRCTLARHLQRKWEAGQTDAEDLTCSGLTFLSRLPSFQEE